MNKHKDYDDRLNPFAADGEHPTNGVSKTSKSAAHATDNFADGLPGKTLPDSKNPFENEEDGANFPLGEGRHATNTDKSLGDRRQSTEVVKADTKSGKSTASARPPPLTHDKVARFLLDNQLLLSALEFYTELLDHKIVIPSLRDFFSNPGNFELPLANNADAVTIPGSSRLYDNHNNSKPGADFGDRNSLYRAGSYSTLSDSVSLGDVDLIGARRDDIVTGGNIEAVPSGRVGLLEYELRKARETIQQLRDSLTTAATTNAVPNRTDAEIDATGAVDTRVEAVASTDGKSAIPATIEASNNEQQSVLNHHPLQKHELRALNFLVSEYLVEHGYKLTSITFSDENPEQDFDDWDDVGLNTAKPDSLVSLYEQHVAGGISNRGILENIGNFQRQSSCRTIVGKQSTNKQDTTEPNRRKDSASQTSAEETAQLDDAALKNPEIRPEMQDVGIQVDLGLSSQQQIASLFSASNVLPTAAHVEQKPTDSKPKLHATSLIRNEMFHPDQFQSTLLRFLLTSSSLINLSPNDISLDADELRLHSMIDSISPTSTSDEIVDQRNKSLSISCLKYVVPNIILAKRQEIVPVLAEAYLFLHIPSASVDAVEAERESLLKQLFNIVNKPDDSQRRLLLKALQKICYYSSAQRLENQLLPLCWSQASHKYPERRQLVAEACAVVSQYVTNDMNSSLVLSTLKQMWSEERVLSVRRSIVLGLGVCCSRLYDNTVENEAVENSSAGDEKFSFVHALFWQCATSNSDAIILSDAGFQCVLPLCAYLALKRLKLTRYVEVEFLNRLRHLTRRQSESPENNNNSPVIHRSTSVTSADDDDDSLSAVQVESRILILLRALNVLCTPICAQLIAAAAVYPGTSRITTKNASFGYADDDSQQIFKLRLFVQQILQASKSKLAHVNDLNSLLEHFNSALLDHFGDRSVESEPNPAWNDMLLWTSDVFIQQLAKSCVNMPSNDAKFISAMSALLTRLVDILNSRVLAQKIILPTLSQHFEQAVCSRIFSRSAIFPVYFSFSMNYFVADVGAEPDAGVADAISQLNTLMLATASPPPPVFNTSDEENQQKQSIAVCADGFIYIFRQILFTHKYTTSSSTQLQRNEAVRLLQQLARHPSQQVQLLVAKILAVLFETIFSGSVSPISEQTKQTLIDGLSEPLFQLAADSKGDAETRRFCVMPLVLLLRNSYSTNSTDSARVLPLLTNLFDEQQKPSVSNSSQNVVDVAAECVFALNAVDGALTMLDYDSFQHFLLPRLSYMVARSDVSSNFSSRRRAEVCAALLQAYVSVTCSPHFAHSPPIKTSVKQSLLRLQRELQQQQQQLMLAGGGDAQQQQQEYLHLCQSLMDKCHLATSLSTGTDSAAAGGGGSAISGSNVVLSKLKGMQPFSRGNSKQ